MPIVYRSGGYPYVTIARDVQGCLHMWPGKAIPNANPMLPTVDGEEAPVFIQNSGDVDSVLSYLSKAELESVTSGYCIQTKHIPDEYFLED